MKTNIYRIALTNLNELKDRERDCINNNTIEKLSISLYFKQLNTTYN